MSLPRKLATFAVMDGGWLTWLLIGYSTGGVAAALLQAAALLRLPTWMNRWWLSTMSVRVARHAIQHGAAQPPLNALA